jgi:hypothetical protein
VGCQLKLVRKTTKKFGRWADHAGGRKACARPGALIEERDHQASVNRRFGGDQADYSSTDDRHFGRTHDVNVGVVQADWQR